MNKSLLSVQLVGAGLALLFANACVIVSDDTNDTNAEVGDGDGDPGDGDGDATTTGDGDGDDASEQGGDGDGDNGDGDGDPSGDGDGDPEPDPAVVEACMAACGVFDQCQVPVPNCLAACTDSHVGLDAECLALELELTECIADLDCVQLAQFMDEEPLPYPCQAEFEASCDGGGGECIGGVGVGEGPGQCDISQACDGEPERSIECDGSICTCYVDAVEVGSCSGAVAICENPETSQIDACCG